MLPARSPPHASLMPPSAFDLSHELPAFAPQEAPPALSAGGACDLGIVADEPAAVEQSDLVARFLGRFVSPWLASLIVHLSLMLLLALIVLHAPRRSAHPGLVASQAARDPQLDALALQPVASQVQLDQALQVLPEQPHDDPQIALQTEKAAAAKHLAVQREPWPTASLMSQVGPSGGGLAGRTPAARARLVGERGGSAASEAAVARGLAWLAEHQLDDGSWRLNHHLAPRCQGQCRHPGNLGSTTAATGLALLPFLGAGQTHEQGQYRDVVRKGIYYLGSRMRLTEQGGDLQEGTMYAQGLATLALCEAYAMSGDESLRDYCQAAVDFVVHAQHPGGGWRYLPGQAGDTTVFGWQLMALKSGQLAALRVPSPTFSLADNFLDSVQTEGGANYGYTRPEKNPTMSAIGLLCRMYLGWPREHEALGRGVAFLVERGPSPNNMYYNYYATQVLHHYGGEPWEPWNRALRDHLVATQSGDGHETGSWYFEDSHTKSAGRLYNTAVAVMILEVYYRYMPLYGSEAVATQ